MRAALFFSAFALAGCASSSPGPVQSGRPEIVRVGDGSATLRVRPGDGPVENAIAYPIDQVWRVLPAVFDSLGVPVSTLDLALRQIGNSGLKAHKKLGNVSLARYIDCGQTQGFPSAETYDIHLSVLTQLRASGSGSTTVLTTFEAAGRPMAFRGDYTKCSSKGELESQILAAVKARLQK